MQNRRGCGGGGGGGMNGRAKKKKNCAFSGNALYVYESQKKEEKNPQCKQGWRL